MSLIGPDCVIAAQASLKSNCPQFGGLHVLREGCSDRELRYSGRHLSVSFAGSPHGSVPRPRQLVELSLNFGDGLAGQAAAVAD